MTSRAHSRRQSSAYRSVRNKRDHSWTCCWLLERLTTSCDRMSTTEAQKACRSRFETDDRDRRRDCCFRSSSQSPTPACDSAERKAASWFPADLLSAWLCSARWTASSPNPSRSLWVVRRALPSKWWRWSYLRCWAAGRRWCRAHTSINQARSNVCRRRQSDYWYLQTLSSWPHHWANDNHARDWELLPADRPCECQSFPPDPKRFASCIRRTTCLTRLRWSRRAGCNRSWSSCNACRVRLRDRNPGRSRSLRASICALWCAAPVRSFCSDWYRRCDPTPGARSPATASLESRERRFALPRRDRSFSCRPVAWWLTPSLVLWPRQGDRPTRVWLALCFPGRRSRNLSPRRSCPL